MTSSLCRATAVCTALLATLTYGCTGQSPTRPMPSAGSSPLFTTAGSATSAVTIDTSRARASVTFTLSGCPSLPGLTIAGSGEELAVTNSRIDADGVTHVEANVLVTGTATDNDGGNYGFNYHNHASQEIAPGGFPFSAVITDHFNLVGSGRGNQMAVNFVARLTFTSPTDPPQVEFVHIHGNPFQCDPI